MTILGVLADTHIPDHASSLDPRVLDIFRQSRVDAILHAGDVTVPRVLKELEQVAPVYAVKGNRDIFYLNSLPLQLKLTFNGVVIGMAHGHGTFRRYMVDKFRPLMLVPLQDRHTRRMLDTFPDVDVIVFGHMHFPVNERINGKLLFNPGSTSYPQPPGGPASVGLLSFDQDQPPRGEIIALDSWQPG